MIHIEKNREITRADAEYLITDATEQPVRRPKKGRKRYYSGKQGKHTLKIQFIVSPDGTVRSVSKTYPGKVHDFGIYKQQKNRDRFLGIPKKGDSGYQGIGRYDAHAEIPFKKPKNGKPTAEQKAYDRDLSRKRIKVENVIREVKIFKILSGIYRNRRRDHGIKTNIIAGIVNMKVEKRNIKQAA